MTILGLDLAKDYGWAVVSEDGAYVSSGHRSLQGPLLGQKLWQLHLSLADLCTEYAPDFVVIEKPHSPHYGASRSLFAYAGIAELVAHVRECGYLELGRAECCRSVLGDGHAKKVSGVVWARQFKPLLNSDDEADALMVAMAAHRLRGGEERVSKPKAAAKPRALKPSASRIRKANAIRGRVMF